MKYSLYAGVAVAAMGFASPSMAGSIFLTGHDNDFHESAAAHLATLNALKLVKGGSSLPVLTFDAGSELQTLMTDVGQAFVNVDPSVAANVTAALFDHSVYSAFVVASVTSCGGCDNTPAAIDNITAQSAAIAAFFNAGGGIFGLAGANYAGAYAYVPESASNPGGSPPSFGYVQTADGLAAGLTPVNGDTTHNFFNEPGTGGLSSAYKVSERLGDPVTGTPESVFVSGGIITCTGTHCVIVPTPEPVSLALLGVGLFGLAAARSRRRG